VKGEGWKVAVPNALAYAKAGKQKTVSVAVGCESGCSKEATVTLTATSESDKKVTTSKTCKVRM
jgi:glucosamine 6-phosphate synthetase-like amidotransferase/phosphosugar isomerase protein